MKRSLLLCLGLLSGMLVGVAQGQSPACLYALDLEDRGGDGWNGAVLQVSVNSLVTAYTLTTGNSDRFLLRLQEGDTLTLAFLSGNFDEEIAYRLRNPQNQVLFEELGPVPVTGQSFSAVISCPACPAPPAFGFRTGDIRAFTAQLGWLAENPSGAFLLEYGVRGFLPGSGVVRQVPGNQVTLTDLAEHTQYDVYLQTLCSSTDTSAAAGPFPFETLWANDVGVIDILNPLSDCDLGIADTVRVLIRNYGGEPQALIPFSYGVNSENVPINMPVDGFYTGVIAKDSAEVAEFDQTFNFSEPGEYEIYAWTELEADSLLANDTARVSIISVPTITSYPYFNNLENTFTGWMVGPDSRASTWSLGIPNGRVLQEAYSGERVWATNLNGNYANGELSYLLSPCLDFSSLAQDPVFSFALQLRAEDCCDGLWVEISQDGGNTWSRLGTASTGTNWYTDPNRLLWTGSGHADGWFIAAHPLVGTAGKGDIRLRFAFQGDFANAREGVMIDNIQLASPAFDLAALSVRNTRENICLIADDQVTITLGNLGRASLNAFTVAYQVNGGPITTEQASAAGFSAGQKRTYTFRKPFDSSQPGRYDIKAWVVGESAFTQNDTAYYTFLSTQNLPFTENFEGGEIPAGWQTSSRAIVTNGHGNSSFVLAGNLFSGEPRFNATTPVFGPLGVNDSIRFDYRLVSYAGEGLFPFTPGANDKVEIFVSTDCGQSLTKVGEINKDNHQPSADFASYTIHLGDYTGKFIQITILGSWGQSDYWLDLDNFNTFNCPASLALDARVIQDETRTGSADGSATVSVGVANGPYTFQWSNGSDTRTINGLRSGVYQLTVTDRFGCSDQASVTIGTITSIRELPDGFDAVALQPNPTTGNAWLQVTLRESGPIVVQVFNSTGQLVAQQLAPAAREHQIPLDLNQQASGIYLIRALAHGQTYSTKLLLTH
ncbi:MAG: T9SS type A sorting domain-containing protein [Lewinellaceae bacterium]|nr:T9SS type A sorting domain-containing protein [Lewinellaceae bacterium]